MVIVMRIIERIEVFVSRTIRAGWFNKPVGAPDVLILALFLRFIALLGLIVRFGLNKATYVDSSFLVVRVSLLVFFFYFCALLFTRSVKRESFISSTSKWIQVIADVLVFSIFYFLTRDMQSEVFVLYFLPLFIAAEYFSLVETMGGLAIASLSFSVTLVAISLRFGAYPEQWLWRVLFPRQFFLFAFVGAFLYRRRFRVSPDLKQQQRALTSHLEHVEDGVYVIDAQYRLLFINDTLRQKHGEPSYGKKCFAFLLRSDIPCEECPCTAMLGAYKDHGAQKIVQQFCIDRDGQQYLAEMTLSPVFSDSGDPAMFVGRVRNLSERYELREELEQYVRHAEQAAEVFSRELRRKNELLNRQLASIFSASLAAVESDGQETLSRMLQVTAEMLGCQAGALRLMGKNPEGHDSLVLQRAYGYSAIWEERRRFLDLDDRSIAVECFLSEQPQIWRDIQDGSAGRELYESYFAKQVGLHSVACFPLILRRQEVGTVSLYRSTAREFTPDEVRLGQSIANYMAIIIENFQLYEGKSAQATERQRWLDAIHQVSVQLAGFESLDSLMQLAVQITKDRLNSEVSSIFLLEDNVLRKKATAGVDVDWFVEESYGIGEGITGSCLVTANGTKYGRPILENVVEQSSQVVKENLQEYQAKLQSGQVKHLIAVPLNGREGPFGVLRIVNRLREDGRLCETGFVEEDVNLLNTIACEVAIAVEKAKLLEEAQCHVEELSQLQQASQAILSSLDLQMVLGKIVALAGVVADSVWTDVILEEHGKLLVKAQNFQGMAPLRMEPRPQGVSRRVIETRKPIVIDEVLNDGSHNPPLVEAGIKSYAGVPIIVQDRVFGVLFVHSFRPNAFEDKVPLLTAFAGQAAIAIENSRLFELEQKRRHLAETLREASEVVGSTLNLEHVLALILDQVRRVVPYDTASVQLLTGNKLEIIACRGFSKPDRVLKLTFPVDGDFPNYHIVMNQKPYTVDDVRSRYPHFQNESYQATHIRSWLGVPLLFRGQVIGMMSLDSKTIGYYGQEHGELAMAFANQAAMAIENARLYEEMQRRVEELSGLHQISQALGSLTNIKQVYAQLAERIAKLMGVEMCGVLLYDEGEKALVAQLPFYGVPDKVTALVRAYSIPVIKDTLPWHIWQESDFWISNDVLNDPLVSELGLLKQAEIAGIQATLLVPMTVGAKRIGVVQATNKLDGSYFDEDDARILSIFANQAAIAIVNAQLYQEAKDEASRSMALVEVSKALPQVLDPPDLLQLVIDSAVELIGPAEGGMIHLLDKDTKKLQPKVWSGADPASVERATLMEMGRGIAGHVIKKLETINVSDVSEDPRFDESARASYFNSLVVAPMYIGCGEKRIGTLSVHSEAVGAFAASHERLLTTLASQAATAIANAELFDVHQQKRGQLQRILEIYKDFDVEIGMDKLLQRIAQAAGEILGFNVVALKIAEPVGQNLIVQALGGSDKGWQGRVIRSTVPIDEIKSLIQEECKISRSCLIRHGQELWDRIVEWHTNAPHPSGEAKADWFPSVAVLVPLETQDDQLIGFFALGEPCWHRLPSRDDIQVAEIFASAATVAIENARLFEAEKRRATQMAVISEVAQDVTSILELEPLVRRVTESIQRGFGYHHVALFLLNGMARELVVSAVTGAYADVIPSDHRIPLRKGMVGWAAYIGQTQLANKVKEDKRYFQGFVAAAVTQAELSVPLKLAGQVIGVLDIQSDQPNAFDETDVRAMETLSDQIAVAIETARLFSSVQELKEFNENIVQGMEGGVLMEDAEGRIKFVNPKMETMLGYSQQELAGQHWSKIVPPMWEEMVAEETEKRSQGVKGRYEAELLHRDGTRIPVVINATPLFLNGKFTGVLTVFTDITETRRRIAKAERDRLQGELHEALNIFHAGVMLEAEAGQYWLQEGQYGRVETALNRLWKVSKHTYGELSNILQDLRDPILEKEGLVAALTNYAETVKPGLIWIRSELESRLAPDYEHALYRIAQGAISNVLRHAGVSNRPDGFVRVDLLVEDGNLTLRIEDNGKGFDIDAIEFGYPAAFGLERMMQWAKMIGTTLEIDSKPGRGTVVTITISIEEGKRTL